MLKSRKMCLIVTVLLVVSLVVSLPASATNADYQNGGIGSDSSIDENNVFTEEQAVRVITCTIGVTAARRIKWTLGAGWTTTAGVYIYDNGVLVADVSCLVSGTTSYVVPTGAAHYITLQHGATILASCLA